jgi:large subunit ribosomal protein L24
MATSIKVGDTVQVMAGRRNRNPEKPPTRGRVLRVDRERGLVWVEGVNRHVRHLKKSPRYPQGGRLERESPVHVSNVAVVSADGVPVRLARAVRDDEGKLTTRAAKKSGAAAAK